jgi:hypothetical protein
MLLQSEHRTLDPEEADYFYLPIYTSCLIFPVLCEQSRCRVLVGSCTACLPAASLFLARGELLAAWAGAVVAAGLRSGPSCLVGPAVERRSLHGRKRPAVCLASSMACHCPHLTLPACPSSAHRLPSLSALSPPTRSSSCTILQSPNPAPASILRKPCRLHGQASVMSELMPTRMLSLWLLQFQTTSLISTAVLLLVVPTAPQTCKASGRRRLEGKGGTAWLWLHSLL